MTNKQAILSHLDHAQAKGLIPLYKVAARKYDIPVAVLLAKDSRESWLGSYPDLPGNNWYGSDGKSRGISQINTEEYSTAQLIDGNAHEWFINKGAEILKEEMKRFPENLKAALAAYNSGAVDVQNALEKGNDPDSVTTKGNYGSDVLRRAEIMSKEVSPVLSLLPFSISTQQNIKQAALQWVPGFLILSAGGYFVKNIIDQKTA